MYYGIDKSIGFGLLKDICNVLFIMVPLKSSLIKFVTMAPNDLFYGKILSLL